MAEAQPQSVREARWDDELTVRLEQLNLPGAAVANVIRPVICHVEIEGAIAIDVGERHGEAAEAARDARARGHIGEMPVAVVAPAMHAAVVGADQKIERPVARQICEHHTPGHQIGRHHPGVGRDVGKFPTP